MYYFADVDSKGKWRVMADWRQEGGTVINVCGAIDESVARETARCMTKANPIKLS